MFALIEWTINPEKLHIGLENDTGKQQKNCMSRKIK